MHNRSKTDIALVLQSCEQCDNAVDTAIAKLIGPGTTVLILYKFSLFNR